jgi:PAS domain S-box-containing protein
VKTLDRSDPISAAFLRWFEELADCGIVTTDDTLVVRTWNPWLERQTGIAAASAAGRSILDIWPTLADRGFDQYYRDALAGEVRILSERLHKFLVPIRRHVSSMGIAEMAQSARIAPLKVDNDIVGTITVIEDVSERVVSERELRHQIAVSEHARAVAEHASSLKDEFLATLSHEIRTPLNAVLGWIRILRNERGVKSRKRALDVIERNATAQLRLVEDMLDMGRVISGKLKLDARPVELQAVVQAAIDVIAPAAAGKNTTIHTAFGPGRLTVNADPDRLQQVVWNVLSNAVKFTGRKGRIDVRITSTADSVDLSVSDNGQGITPEFLPFVFDRFRQADASAGRRHGGLGLGLALVRQIVELHGGTVAVNSQGENLGTTFSIRLPTTRTPHPARSNRRQA